MKDMMMPVVLPKPEIHMAQPVVGKLKQISDNPAEEESTNMIHSRLVPPPTKCLAHTVTRQLQRQGGAKGGAQHALQHLDYFISHLFR